MAITKACSYKATIQLPEDPSEYSAIQVTISQENLEIIKTKQQLDIDENTVILKLDQSETKQFTACKKAFIQIRLYKSQYEAPGSKIFAVDVCPSLNEDVLP